MALTEQDLLAIKGVVAEAVNPSITRVYSDIRDEMRTCRASHDQSMDQKIELHEAKSGKQESWISGAIWGAVKVLGLIGAGVAIGVEIYGKMRGN
jgi:hypothetical protein